MAENPRVGDSSRRKKKKKEDPFRASWHSDMPRVFKGDRTAPRAAILFFAVLILFVGAVRLRNSDWSSGPALYGTLEALSALLAFVAGALALVRFYSKKQETFLFIGIGLIGTGFLDLFSALMATGGWGDWTRDELSGLAAWSFTASGIFLSLYLLASWISWRRSRNRPDRPPVREVTVYLVALLLGVIIFAVFDFFPLIGALQPDQFVRRPVEFVPGMLFLVCAMGYLTKGHWRVDAFEHWLSLTILVGIMAHGAYMPFSSAYHDAAFLAAHGLKVVGYSSVLVGLLASVYVTFRREEEVAESTREANTALAREIDYRRQAERVIQESEERLQGFLDSAHDLIQSVDPQGNLVYVNRAWKDVLGYTDEEVESLTFFQILAPGCRERCKKEFFRILQGEALPALEVDFIAADGRIVQCSGNADVWSKDGEVVATRSIFRDITEQLQARRKLEAFQANLRALVENTGDAIWSVDRDMRLITFNTAFSMAMEVRTNREPMVGDEPAECLASDDVSWYEDMYERALFGETFSELRDEEMGGQVRSYEFFFNPIREATGITGVAAFGQDVTARRRTQLALHMAKEEAEQANLAKSQFLASMSHELRTPLNSVIGFTNILLKNRGGNLVKQELGFLDRIIANGKHLLDLINEVLDLAKIEAGRMELDLATVDLPDLIESTLLQLESQVKDKDVDLRGVIPDHIHPFETDPGKLRQIIINLVGNALKFTKEGEVTVEVSLHDDGHTPSAITVRDTGIGIPPDRLKAIFEAFQQADGSTSREFGGTGLGLTISRSLCQLMGFDLSVQSQVGEGSEFTVLLHEGPTAEQQLMEEALKPIESSRPASPDSEAGSKRHGRARILVIDDDPDSRGILARQLEDLGFEVLTAPSAELGIQTARNQRPDLITLDLIMPEMTGWEALKNLKETRDLQDIPVIIVSVVAGEQDRGNLFGAVDLLTKPVDPEDLLKVLRRNLGEARGSRILVVEDDPVTQELFRKHLSQAGLQVTLTGNGQEAETMMEEFTPDLILLDLMMPVMDGTAFLQRLRKDPSRQDVPVVICTGKELLFDERRRLLAQATEIVHKGENLEDTLKAVLASHFPMKQDSTEPKSGTPGVEGAQDGP